MLKLLVLVACSYSKMLITTFGGSTDPDQKSRYSLVSDALTFTSRNAEECVILPKNNTVQRRDFSSVYVSRLNCFFYCGGVTTEADYPEKTIKGQFSDCGVCIYKEASIVCYDRVITFKEYDRDVDSVHGVMYGIVYGQLALFNVGYGLLLSASAVETSYLCVNQVNTFQFL